MTSKNSRNESGVLGTKLGMTQVFDDNNRMIPVTVVKAGPCVVTQVRKPDVDGYSAIQIGYGEIDPRKVNQPQKGHFAKAGVSPRRHIAEIRTDNAESYEIGQEITLDIFEPGAEVDVTGTSKGKGYAGVMKRHGFHGVSASHGAHRNHRKPGSIGGCATPGRVFKGMRMAGRMGNDRVTTLGLKVVRVDTERGLLLIKGAIPGNAKGVVYVRNTVKNAAKGGAQ